MRPNLRYKFLQERSYWSCSLDGTWQPWLPSCSAGKSHKGTGDRFFRPDSLFGSRSCASTRNGVPKVLWGLDSLPQGERSCWSGKSPTRRIDEEELENALSGIELGSMAAQAYCTLHIVATPIGMPLLLCCLMTLMQHGLIMSSPFISRTLAVYVP